jgi:hypothetical protein
MVQYFASGLGSNLSGKIQSILKYLITLGSEENFVGFNKNEEIK